MTPTFAVQPVPATFIVNVIHAHPGKQEAAFAIIEEAVRDAAARQPGVLWSDLSKSTDGQTVVNIEAIADSENMGAFFAGPTFLQKFRALDAVATREFHTCRTGTLVLPGAVTGRAA